MLYRESCQYYDIKEKNEQVYNFFIFIYLYKSTLK